MVPLGATPLSGMLPMGAIARSTGAWTTRPCPPPHAPTPATSANAMLRKLLVIQGPMLALPPPPTKRDLMALRLRLCGPRFHHASSPWGRSASTEISTILLRAVGLVG